MSDGEKTATSLNKEKFIENQFLEVQNLDYFIDLHRIRLLCIRNSSQNINISNLRSNYSNSNYIII